MVGEKKSSFLLVHLFFFVVIASQRGGGAVSGDEGGLLLRDTGLALLDRQSLGGPAFDLEETEVGVWIKISPWPKKLFDKYEC